jgi:hypothetical protein
MAGSARYSITRYETADGETEPAWCAASPWGYPGRTRRRPRSSVPLVRASAAKARRAPHSQLAPCYNKPTRRTASALQVVIGRCCGRDFHWC